MKIIIDAETKEIADLILAVKGQQSKAIKRAIWMALSKFCDDYDLHDDELDAALGKITE